MLERPGVGSRATGQSFSDSILLMGCSLVSTLFHWIKSWEVSLGFGPHICCFRVRA